MNTLPLKFCHWWKHCWCTSTYYSNLQFYNRWKCRSTQFVIYLLWTTMELMSIPHCFSGFQQKSQVHPWPCQRSCWVCSLWEKGYGIIEDWKGQASIEICQETGMSCLPTFLNSDSRYLFPASTAAWEWPGTKREEIGVTAKETESLLLHCCSVFAGGVSCCQYSVSSCPQWDAFFESHINHACFKFFHSCLTPTITQPFYWAV